MKRCILLLMVASGLLCEPRLQPASVAAAPAVPAPPPAFDFDTELPHFPDPSVMEAEVDEYFARIRARGRDVDLRAREAAALINAGGRGNRDETLRLARRVLAEYPDTPSAEIAIIWICNELDRRHGMIEALAFVNEQEALRPGGTTGVSSSILNLASKMLEAHCNDEAEALLHRILERHGGTNAAGEAMTALAEVWRRRGNLREEVAWLKRSIEFEPNPKLYPEWIDPSYARQQAIVRLTLIYAEARLWEHSLILCEHWRTTHHCGNGQATDQMSSVTHRMVCLMHLKRHREAAELGLAEIPWWDGLCSQDSIRWLLYVLYRDAQQLPDLHAMIQKYDREEALEMQRYIAKNMPRRPLEWERRTQPFHLLMESGRLPKGLNDRKELQAKFPPAPRGSLPRTYTPRADAE